MILHAPFTPTQLALEVSSISGIELLDYRPDFDTALHFAALQITQEHEYFSPFRKITEEEMSHAVHQCLTRMLELMDMEGTVTIHDAPNVFLTKNHN